MEIYFQDVSPNWAENASESFNLKPKRVVAKLGFSLGVTLHTLGWKNENPANLSKLLDGSLHA